MGRDPGPVIFAAAGKIRMYILLAVENFSERARRCVDRILLLFAR